MRKRFSTVILCCFLLSVQAAGISPSEKIDVENAMIEVLCEDVLGMRDGTVSKLEKLSAIDPDNDALHYNLALRYFKAQKYSAAIKSIRRAREIDPGNLCYEEFQAMLYAQIGDSEKSAATYLDLMEKAPLRYANAYTITLLADQSLSQRKDSLALEQYDQALSYDPEYGAALAGKAEVYRLRGNVPAFLSTMKTFAGSTGIAPYPKTAYLKSVLEHTGNILYRNWGQQLDDIVGECLKVHPSDSSALKLGGWWFYGTGEQAKGKECLVRFAELYPDCLEAHYNLLQIKSMEKDNAGMIEEAKIIVSMTKGEAKNYLDALCTLGDCYYNINDKKNAYACYDKVLKIDPDHTVVLNNYAYFLCLDRKNLKKAETMSRQCIEKEPENPTYLDTYGWVLHLRGRDAEAKMQFKKAMVHGGKESAEVISHYAEVLDALGEKDLASFYRGMLENKK